MDAAICPRCNTRHWSTQPCPADREMGPIVTSPGLKRRVMDAVVAIEGPQKKSAVREKPVEKIAAGLRDAIEVAEASQGCPVCAARRAQKAAQMRRYREKSASST